MSKHLVDIDPDLLERARAAAGTKTIKATVDAGLRRLADRDLVLRHIQRLRRTPADATKWLEKAREPRFPGK